MSLNVPRYYRVLLLAVLTHAVCCFISPKGVRAEVLHWWRFEDSPGFLEDSVGGATLNPRTPSSGAQVLLPSDARGVNFGSHSNDTDSEKIEICGRKVTLKLIG